MPLAIAFVAAAAALLGYSHQKRLDRRNDLVTRRREAYSALLRVFTKIVTANSPDVQHEYHLCRADIYLIGSDRVVEEVRNLHDMIAVDGSTRSGAAEKLDAYARVVFAMRRDCFERTRLTVDQLKKLSPFGDAA